MAEIAAAPATAAAVATAAPDAASAKAPEQLSLLGEAASAPTETKTSDAKTAPVAEPAKPADGEAAKEAKPADAKTSDEAKKADPAKTAPADIEIKLPDGVKADEGVLKEFKELAKAKGLNSEQAQAMFDLDRKIRIDEANRIAKQHEELAEKHRKTIESDKELGGDNLAQTKALVAKVMNDPRTPPEFLELTKDPVLGNHPGLVRLLANWGKAIAEDSVAGLVAGGPTTANLSEKEFRDNVFYRRTADKHAAKK